MPSHTSAVEPPPSAEPSSSRPLPGWFPPLFYLLLACVFLWRSTFAGDVFLPAGMLAKMAPYASALKPDSAPAWNPLRWDGIAQFYPWRHFAAQTLHSGYIPLWNPYQFCGTPFVANSQSAVLYPGNLLFYLLPTTLAFNASALLHLTLCGWFTYLLLRQLRCDQTAALLGGVTFAFSAWQVAWLQLPTFLATSCWFPLLLRQVHRMGYRVSGFGYRGNAAQREGFPVPRTLYPVPCIVGLMLLAGHLQIAFYGLLAGTLFAIGLMVARGQELGAGAALRILGGCVAGLILGVMLALPQLLPALELSQVSHRAGKASAEGYRAYTEYALPLAGLAQLTLPDVFGNDYDADNPYWGFYVKNLSGPGGEANLAIRHNAAETAAYVGILPLLLALFALARGLRRGAWDRRVIFFGGLALLTLLLALGTPLNALFYFVIPGFGQSGSPARCLVLWALAMAGLAAFGLDALTRQLPTKRELGVVGLGFALIFAVGLSALAGMVGTELPGFKSLKVPALGEVFGRLGMDWLRLAVMLTAGGALLFTARAMSRKTAPPSTFSLSPFAFRLSACALCLVVLDLFWTGIAVNPTARPEAVYPQTAGIAYLQQRVGHERIFPVNQAWNLYDYPPAVLPPNGAMVYGLHDVQGYDSLFTGQYKAFANQFARPNRQGVRDASPPEVGNLVFFQNPNAMPDTQTAPASPLLGLTSAALIVTLPAETSTLPQEAIPPGTPVYSGEMQIYAVSQPAPRAHFGVSGGAGGSEAIVWKQDDPTRVTLEVTTPTDTAVVLNDQSYPGWQATMDGKPTAILATPKHGPLGRAVPVPAGKHTVQFLYTPAAFRVGLYLACLAIGVLAVFRTRRA